MEPHSVPQVGEGLRQRAGTADVQMIQNAPNFCPNHTNPHGRSCPFLPFCARREGGARGGCCGGRDGCVALSKPDNQDE